MALLDRQKRYQRIGNIRLGTKTPKGAPKRLDTIRLTSQAKPLIEEAAEQYGGTVEPWENPRVPGVPQWQVITEASEIPVRIPEQKSDQMAWYEAWTAAGINRKCDGFNETLNSTPCLCDPESRVCKPRTVLLLMLPEVSGANGVWTLSSTGLNAADELVSTVALLEAHAPEPEWTFPATLAIESRSSQQPGQPRKDFVVPVLRLPIRLADLLGAPALAPPSGSGPALTDGDGGVSTSSSPPVAAPPPTVEPDEHLAPDGLPHNPEFYVTAEEEAAAEEAAAEEAEVVDDDTGPSDVLLAHLELNPMEGTNAEIEQRTRTLYNLMGTEGYWPGDAFHAALRKHLKEHGLAESGDGPHWSNLGVKVQQQGFAARSFEAARKKVVG